jgi:hypothetical protein
MRLLLGPCLLLFVACGGPPPPTAPGSVVLGTTQSDQTGFLPLTGDQTLVPGAQGGFHIWLKYRLGGMPAAVKIARTVKRVSDGRIILDAGVRLQQVGEPGADGMWELPEPLPSFMCPAPVGMQVQDQPARFDVVVTTEEGAPLGEARAEVTPHCPPTGDPQHDFCERICTNL